MRDVAVPRHAGTGPGNGMGRCSKLFLAAAPCRRVTTRLPSARGTQRGGQGFCAAGARYTSGVPSGMALVS